MTTPFGNQSRSILQNIARRVMVARGLAPEFAPEALVELEVIKAPAAPGDAATRDLRSLLWCSIDNDDSRDLDQLSVAEAMVGGTTKIMVAIADVSALVRPGSALDDHARQNTTSVYTAARIFPMLPEKLSTDLTSLNPAVDRLAVVVEMIFSPDGTLATSAIYPAMVRNQAKLAYNSVAAWFEGTAPAPAAVSAVAGLADNLKLQQRVTDQLAAQRHQQGALSLETLQAHPVFDGAVLTGLQADSPNSAKRLIEDLMIAANGVTARYLAAKKYPSIRRVVRIPRNWDRIVELAAEHQGALPSEPDGPALEQFLVKAKAADPEGFPELSLSIIKLMGAGEYVLEFPRRSGDRALRPGGQGLCSFHGTQPAFSRRHHAAAAQGGAGGPAATLCQRRAGRTRATLYRAGGRGQEGGTAGRKIRGRHAPGFELGPAIRRHRHGRLAEGHLGSPFVAAGRRETGRRFLRSTGGGPSARAAGSYGRGARVYRFQGRGLIIRRRDRQGRFLH